MTNILNLPRYNEHPVTNSYTESLNSLIRVVNRCGRGYSFEALRAKILFSAGAHKIVRTKFQRADASNGFERMTTFSYSLPSTPEHKNYGVVTSTLLRLLEEGKL